jgi:hypothetical protein
MSSVNTSYNVPKARRGAASLIYCNYGEDSQYTAFFQDTVKLKKAMEGYDFTVLLKHDTTPSWADLSEADEKLADIKAPPTTTNLFKYMIELAQDGFFFDIYVLAHGWPGQFGAKNVRDYDEDRVTAADITRELASSKTGFTQMPIRMVFPTACYAHSLGETWRSVGAKATCGARGINWYPNRFGNFIDDWNKGVPFNEALRGADTDLVRTASQTYIAFVDAPAKKKQGASDGCSFGNTVLGDKPCAKDYFVSCWGMAGEWQEDMSGKENMNYSSYMFRGGDIDITKNTRPYWG